MRIFPYSIISSIGYATLIVSSLLLTWCASYLIKIGQLTLGYGVWGAGICVIVFGFLLVRNVLQKTAQTEKKYQLLYYHL